MKNFNPVETQNKAVDQKKKYKISRLFLTALFALLLLLLPLIYQETVNAVPLEKATSNTNSTQQQSDISNESMPDSAQSKTPDAPDASTPDTNGTSEALAKQTEAISKNSSPKESSEVTDEQKAAFMQNMSFQANPNSYDYESIPSLEGFGKEQIPQDLNGTISKISPVLGTAVAFVAGDIIGTTNLYFEELRTKLNFVNTNLHEKVIPALMPYKMNDRYTISSKEGMNITIKSKIVYGDSAGNILQEWLSMQTILDLVQQSKDIHPITSLRVGRPYFITIDTVSKKLMRFEYEIDNTDILVLDFTGTNPNVSKESIIYDLKLAYIEGNIQVNFFDSVLRTGENANFAIQLADIFSYDIDFIREIQNDDEFYALVEKRYRDGEFKGYGRIIGAKFVNAGYTHNAYLFHDASDATRFTYFDEEGKALQKAFLRTPVHFTRVSSRYSMNRKHPILGITRPHQGIDYAARKGTPVVAVGDGTVTRAAYTGGYGNLISLRHTGGLQSQYGHLSGYAKGVRAGAKVSQGQTIGYVGSTGLSTGPHLDFRIKKNGKFVNPDKVIVPSKPPVPQAQKVFFDTTMNEIDSYMTAKKKVEEFDSSAWFNGAS